MSAEEKWSETSTRPPTTSQSSTQTYFSEGEDDEIKLDEEDFQEESLQEEFPEKEEYLEEETCLEEKKCLKGNEYGYETVYLPQNQHLEEKELDSYVYEEFLDEDKYLEEGENLEEEKYLERSGYLDKEEYLKDEFKVTHSSQTTPKLSARSPASGSPKSSSFCQIPVSKTASQYPSLCTVFPAFYLKSDGRLLALTDRATQTEWSYHSKSAILLKSKLKGEQDSSKVMLINKMSDFEDYILAEVGKEEENVMESVSKTNYFENLMDEPCEALEVEDLDDNFLNSTTYQTVFRTMLKEMAARSELEEDIDIPMTGHLESETRRKLGILLKKNFGKYKETILWIMKKREKLGTFTFRLLDQKSPEIEEPEEAQIKKPHHIVRRKKKAELDTEWMMKKTKVHQGDGKVILYPSGTLFQVLFPDGTGQIQYPLEQDAVIWAGPGNLAMLILTTNAKHFTYIILEDSKQTWIRALINNSGHATFYDENRNIWLSLSHNLGYYFIRGGGQRAWNWWNLNLHIHAPPVQPVSLTINQYIKVQIRSQDNIFFYFINKKKQIRLNLGTRYKYITPEVLNEMKKKRIQEVEFGSTAQKIQILLGKMSKILNLLTISDLEKFVESAMTFLVEAFPKKTFQFQR